MAHDALGRSPVAPLKVLTSGTNRGPLEDSQGTNTKTDDFLEAIVLVLHIYSCFLLEDQAFKSSKRERPRDVYKTQLRDVSETK